MNNRLALGLAVGGGYVLGRTKKAKLAFAVGTMVAGRRMKLNPRDIGRLATDLLEKNPQFKELGDQLREDLRGTGRAAAGALVDRQINNLADRVHARTLDVRDRVAHAGELASSKAKEGADTAKSTAKDTAGSAKNASKNASKNTSKSASGTAKNASKSTARKTTGTAKKAAKKAPAKAGTAKKGGRGDG
ncbi:hypothetical protein GCM10009801_38390 [Streptomyces albiaxialis]|uniref:DNA primase n=1 Tax=Streptomyces albiaxialis TaxID=329523 RepID=A0ABN2W1U3_9ACTN